MRTYTLKNPLEISVKILILFIVLLGQSVSIGQTWMDEIFIEGKNPTFYEIQQKANEYWTTHDPTEKGKGYKAFKRWENYWEHRLNEDGTFPESGINQNNFEKYLKSTGNKKQGAKGLLGGANWVGAGPNNSAGGYNGIGRVNSIAFHPSNTNIIYVGSAGGGFWKTSNGGTTWTTTTDNIGALGISGIAVVPSTPNTIYIATGDGDATDNWSIGVLKSIDGGNTWNTTGLNWANSFNKVIRRIIIDPDDENNLLVASSDGIYRSTDAGATWSQKQTGNFFDIEANPNASTSIFYASTGNTIYKSTNNGNSWTNIQTISGSNRIALAVTPANNTVVYALSSLSSNSGFNGLYKSTNSGDSYAVQSTTPNILDGSQDGSNSGGQGWYDLTLAVDPANENILYTGGITNWKSTNGGVNWSLNSFWYSITGVPTVHADKHAMEWQGNTLFQGVDGGVYKTSNGGSTWTDVSGDLVISQMYRLGVSKADTRVITGLQDNGTKLRNTAGVWTDNIGGDGMECAINPVTPTIMYGEYQFGFLQRSTNGGASWTEIKPTGTGNGSWITPFAIDQATPTTLYVGYDRVYKTTNQGTAWTDLSGNLGVGNLTILNVAPSNSNYIYAGTSNSLFRTINGGTNWTAMTMPGSSTNMITIHPTDPNIIYAVRQNYSAGAKVYKSINGGATWTNISGSLPNIPANTIAYSKCTQDGLYVGMDVGIYYRDNTLSDWVLFNTGLPNVEIQEIEIDDSENVIYAATYGRGLWKSDLYMSAPLVTISLGALNGPTTCGGTDGSIVLNFTNVPDGSYTISYKKNGTPTTMTKTVTSNTTTLTGLTMGNYTEFSITANSCIGSNAGPALLNDPVPPIVDDVASQSVCSGNPVAPVNFTGTPGATYSWTNDNTGIGLAASGSGNILGYIAPNVMTTQIGNIAVTPMKAGCVGLPKLFTITIKPLPVIAISSVSYPQPPCTNNDGSITFNFTNVPNGTYTMSYTVNSLPASAPITVSGGAGTLSGLAVGIYNNFSLTANGCTGMLNSSISLDCAAGGACPTIGSLSVSNSISCKTSSITLTANGLANMGGTYGISFVSSTVALADPYFGGTVLGTVPNSGLTNGGTQAVFTTTMGTSGSYFLYAILSPVPADISCRPSKSSNVKIIDCTPVISIPCACKNNASTLINGQFNETISVNAPAGQTWTVTSVTGLYQTSSPAPPGAPINIPVGFVLTSGPVQGDGSVNYTLMGVHVDAIGYSVSISNGIGVSGTLSSICYYPNPQINGLASTYCANDPSVTLSGSALLGGPPGGNAMGTGSFTINGTPNTIFNPAALGAGTHNVIYTFDAADGVPNSNHPGCIQSVNQSVLVNPIPTVNSVASQTYCPGAAVPASNFTGTPSGVAFNWVRTAGAIGLASLNGTGNVPGFVATNTGAAPLTSTFTVTPSFTAGGKTCTGTPITYSITVNPTPTVASQSNKIYCSGVATGAITFTGTATSYNWTNSNTAIGLAASGTASPSIPSWIPINNTNNPITGIITVTPVYTNGSVTCTGSPITFTITINPGAKAVCKNFTLYLDATGNANLSSSDINGGSSGGGISLSKTSFNCTNIGDNIVVLTVTDACNATSSCTAIVSVIDNLPPVLSSVPANITIECSGTLPGIPTVTATDNCSALVTFSETNNQSPYKTLCGSINYDIKRTWTATDPSGNKSTKTQVISLVDLKAPKFVDVPPAFITVDCDDDNDNNVDPLIVDGCDETPSLILDIKYKFNPNGCKNSYVSTYTWTAGDKCGNTAQYIQKITVEDKTPPVIVCPPNISIVSSVPTSVSWISPKANDNCDGGIPVVQISGPKSGSLFDPNTVTTIIYSATDECGNVSTCSFTVSVKKISTKVGVDINGEISDSKNPPNQISADIQINGSINQYTPTTGGKYLFSSIPNGSNLEIFAEQSKFPLNGVNALDLIHISNHILGKKALNSPFKMLAADVNKSKNITTADIVEIRKLILHITDLFSASKSWEFLPSNVKFTTPNNPWLDQLDSKIAITNIQSDKTFNFIGYKMGDVTYDADPNAFSYTTGTRSNETLTLNTTNKFFKKGETIAVSLAPGDTKLAKAMQFTLNYDVNSLEFQKVDGDIPGVTEQNFGLRYLEDGHITGCFEVNNEFENQSLFTLTFKAKADGELVKTLSMSSMITPAQAFTNEDKALELELSFTDKETATINQQVILYQNEPNPFSNNTAIRFKLPSDADATIKFFTVDGTLVKEISGSYRKGENKFEISGNDLPGLGIYFYQFKTGSFVGMQKMVFLK